MRVGFAGTPEFAARALAGLHEGGYTIALVLTQPDRPSGRGMAVTASAVKRYAVAHALHVEQPSSLKAPDVQSALFPIELDVLVVAAYGLILPQAVLAWPRQGCLNIHASLLPRWRGAAPFARAIEAGDATTGVTIMQMESGLDTGPMIRQEALSIAADETAGTLHDRLARVGARLVVETLGTLEREGRIDSVPQPDAGVTYAKKLGRSDRPIDWTADAVAIDRKVRALSPEPGATASWQGAPFEVATVQALEARNDVEHSSGTVVAVTARGIDVACGDRSRLRLLTLQPAGGRRMPASAFAAGRGVVEGARFGPARA